MKTSEKEIILLNSWNHLKYKLKEYLQNPVVSIKSTLIHFL